MSLKTFGRKAKTLKKLDSNNLFKEKLERETTQKVTFSPNLPGKFIKQ